MVVMLLALPFFLAAKAPANASEALTKTIAVSMNSIAEYLDVLYTTRGAALMRIYLFGIST